MLPILQYNVGSLLPKIQIFFLMSSSSLCDFWKITLDVSLEMISLTKDVTV